MNINNSDTNNKVNESTLEYTGCMARPVFNTNTSIYAQVLSIIDIAKFSSKEKLESTTKAILDLTSKTDDDKFKELVNRFVGDLSSYRFYDEDFRKSGLMKRTIAQIMISRLVLSDYIEEVTSNKH